MRLVIGEDEALFREGLRLLLEEQGAEVVAATGDAHELQDLARLHRPDLVVTDVRMPPGLRDDGLRAAVALRSAGQPVVALSQHMQRQYALTLLDAGPSQVGYLLKQRVTDVRQLLADLETVAGGGTVVDPELVTATARRDAVSGLGLTARQIEVMELLAQGRSNTAIAAALHVTERAVKLHIANIFDTLGLAEDPDDNRRVLAVVRYLSR